MNSAGRAKKLGGGSQQIIPTQSITAAGTIAIDDATTHVYVVGSGGAVSTATTIVFSCASIKPGRIVTIVGTDDTNTVTLKKTAPASAAQNYYIASADTVLGNYDVVTIQQHNSGAWYRLNTSDNS